MHRFGGVAVETTDESDEFAYELIYRRLRDELLLLQDVRTGELTKTIKKFFCREYGEHHHVLCSGGLQPEFMVDVLVTSFAPKNLIDKKSLALAPAALGIHLAVESELGGVGASSAYGVMRNAVEDFLKLLLVNARRRMMIMTSLVYASEADHVRARVESLREMYLRCGGLSSGVLIVHLEGGQPRSSQVQAMVHASAVRGFIISEDGCALTELCVKAGTDSVSGHASR
jgi:hypothetical protein